MHNTCERCNRSTTCCGSPLSFWTLFILATFQNLIQPNTVVRECTGQPFDVGDPSHSEPYPSWPPSRTRSSRIQWCESVPVNHSTWKTPLSLVLFILAKQTLNARATKEAWPPSLEKVPLQTLVDNAVMPTPVVRKRQCSTKHNPKQTQMPQ
jgi:hypothetical protein